MSNAQRSATARTTHRTDAGLWVVGADGSAGARHAAAWAAHHARDRANTIRVATAWSIPNVASVASMSVAAPIFDTRELMEAASAATNDAVQAICTELHRDDTTTRSPSPSIEVDRLIARGDPSSVLLDASHDAALLVLGATGHGGFSRLVLGSTSTRCATHASCPTAIVRSDAPLVATRRMMVAFDGSENSRAALDWAMAFAPEDAVIDCVMVWDVTPIVVGADQFFFPEACDLARERFLHLVDQAEQQDALRRGDGVGPAVVRTFVSGHPRSELARHAVDVDLVVTGARGHGAVGAALLGSVSTWLLHHAARPIVVVPDPHASDATASGDVGPH